MSAPPLTLEGSQAPCCPSCGASEGPFWHRWQWVLAQVSMVFGAGVEKKKGPAPLDSVDAHFAAQVGNQIPHLRQNVRPPAPRYKEFRDSARFCAS